MIVLQKEWFLKIEAVQFHWNLYAYQIYNLA